MQKQWNLGWALSLSTLLVTAACGDDTPTPAGAADGGDAAAQASGQDAGAGGGGGSTNGNGGGGSDASADSAPLPVKCAAGEQDNDSDGECAEACSDSVECGDGVCSDVSGETECVCDAGFEGASCDACAEGHEGDDCGTCADGYIESSVYEGACIADPCVGVECGNQGACVAVNDAAECQCNVGWAGDACNTCDAGYEGALCGTCSTGYQPAEVGCIADACVATDCGEGTCEFNGINVTCDCGTGWAVGDGVACDVCALGYLAKDDECVLELPVQNDKLLLWLDAMLPGSIITDQGTDTVYRWRTRDGSNQSASQYTAGNKPERMLSGGMTWIRFDGDDDYLLFSDLVLEEDTYSMFVVARPNTSNGAGTQGILGAVGSEAVGHHGLYLRSQSDGDAVSYLHRWPLANTGSSGVVTSTGFPQQAPLNPRFQFITAERREGEGGAFDQILRGGTDEVVESSDEPAFDAAVDLVLGSRTAASQPLDGDLGEIILFDGAITKAERDQVEAYLRLKWRTGIKFVQI